MKLSRREFLRVFGASAGALLVPSEVSAVASDNGSPSPESKGVLVDLTKCIGCGWCQEACKQSNDLPAEPPISKGSDRYPLSLSARTWTLVEPRQAEDDGELYRVFVKRQCMHCLDPACVSACPVGALQKGEQGAVTYDASRCIGCRYCMVACPFGVPKFEWDEPLPRIQKCTLCADRQEAGMVPACVEACPTGALLFGNRADLIAEAETRIQDLPELYVNHIYGKEEFGGTSWLYLSPVSFDKLGFPILKQEPATKLSEAVALYGTPGMILSVGLLLGGVHYWFTRSEASNLAKVPVRREGEGGES